MLRVAASLLCECFLGHFCPARAVVVVLHLDRFVAFALFALATLPLHIPCGLRSETGFCSPVCKRFCLYLAVLCVPSALPCLYWSVMSASLSQVVKEYVTSRDLTRHIQEKCRQETKEKDTNHTDKQQDQQTRQCPAQESNKQTQPKVQTKTIGKEDEKGHAGLNSHATSQSASASASSTRLAKVDHQIGELANQAIKAYAQQFAQKEPQSKT